MAVETVIRPVGKISHLRRFVGERGCAFALKAAHATLTITRPLTDSISMRVVSVPKKSRNRST